MKKSILKKESGIRECLVEPPRFLSHVIQIAYAVIIIVMKNLLILYQHFYVRVD